MRSIIFTLTLLASVFVARAQAYKFIYYMDDNLNFVQKENATVTAKAYEENGRIVVDCFARSNGIKLVTATFTDSLLGELNGLFKTYHSNTRLESEGNYQNNEMQGVWRYWNNWGLITDSVIYQKGIRVAYGKYEYYFDRITLDQYFGYDSLKNTLYLTRSSFTDSLANTFTEKESLWEKGKLKSTTETFFKGTGGTMRYYDSAGTLTKTENISDTTVIEVKFPGGSEGWRTFLQQNMNANVPMDHNASAGRYTVIVRFAIDAEGNLWDIKAENNPGYGTAEEAIRVIKRSPKWKPARKYGKPYVAFRRQPFTFIVDE